jgi:hypothetical protein
MWLQSKAHLRIIDRRIDEKIWVGQKGRVKVLPRSRKETRTRECRDKQYTGIIKHLEAPDGSNSSFGLHLEYRGKRDELFLKSTPAQISRCRR